MANVSHILGKPSRMRLGKNGYLRKPDDGKPVLPFPHLLMLTCTRIICVWFFMSRIISPTVTNSFMRAYPLHMLPLVSNKSLWEARSRQEWETERALQDACYPMTTFAELIEAKRRSNELFYKRRLETWDAGVDKMGMLINIATDLI